MDEVVSRERVHRNLSDFVEFYDLQRLGLGEYVCVDAFDVSSSFFSCLENSGYVVSPLGDMVNIRKSVFKRLGEFAIRCSWVKEYDSSKKRHVYLWGIDGERVGLWF
jgi:hypothetical protein